MITKQKSLFYFVGDQAFRDLAEAQKADLIKLMPLTEPLIQDKNDWADWILKNAESIVDTLTTTPKSRLRARKSHGAVRKKKTVPTTPAP